MPVSAGSMPDPERLAALISEYRRLDRLRDALPRRQILTEAAQVVDRQAEPKKWAALRSMFAQMSESDNPEAAVAAYQDALNPGLATGGDTAFSGCNVTAESG